MSDLGSGFPTLSNTQNKTKTSSALIHHLYPYAEANRMPGLHTLELRYINNQPIYLSNLSLQGNRNSLLSSPE